MSLGPHPALDPVVGPTLAERAADARQSLTEAEASHQAAIGRLTAERDRLRRDVEESAVVRAQLREQVDALCVEQDRLRTELVASENRLQHEIVERVFAQREQDRLQKQVDRWGRVSGVVVEDLGGQVVTLTAQRDAALAGRDEARAMGIGWWRELCDVRASLAAEREQTARMRAELAQYRSLGTAAQPVAMTLIEGTITVGAPLDAGTAAGEETG